MGIRRGVNDPGKLEHNDKKKKNKKKKTVNEPAMLHRRFVVFTNIVRLRGKDTSVRYPFTLMSLCSWRF